MNAFRISVLFFALAVVASFAGETNTLPNVVTVDGVTYSNVTWRTVTPATVSIFHKTGVASIPLEKLSSELQTRFGYDPKKCAAFREAEKESERKRQEVETQKRQAKLEAEAIESERLTKEAAKQHPLAVLVKDIKNFPRKYRGEAVRVCCEISGFERIQFGKFEGEYTITATGVAAYTSVYDTHSLERDGTYLSEFFIISSGNSRIVEHCHNSMDNNHGYWANVCAVIKETGDRKFYGEVYRIEFFYRDGTIYKTVE